jgi:hypothetical protein
MNTTLTLYQLTAEFAAIQALMEEMPPDLDEKMLARIEALELASGKKLDNYFDYVNYLKMQLTEATKQAEYFRGRKLSLDTAIDYLDSIVLKHFQVRGIKKIVANSGRSIGVVNNSSAGVEYCDRALDTMTQSERIRFVEEVPKIRTEEVKKALLAGEELSFAKLKEKGQHVRYY